MKTSHFLPVLVLATSAALAQTPTESYLLLRDLERQTAERKRMAEEKARAEAQQEALARIERAIAARNDPLSKLENAFYSGAVSLHDAVRLVERLPTAGGVQAIINQVGFDPSLLTTPQSRKVYAVQIEAIQYERRLDALIDAINASVSAHNAALNRK